MLVLKFIESLISGGFLGPPQINKKLDVVAMQGRTVEIQVKGDLSPLIWYE